jgi:hypothetical protein
MAHSPQSLLRVLLTSLPAAYNRYAGGLGCWPWKSSPSSLDGAAKTGDEPKLVASLNWQIGPSRDRLEARNIGVDLENSLGEGGLSSAHIY